MNPDDDKSITGELKSDDFKITVGNQTVTVSGPDPDSPGHAYPCIEAPDIEYSYAGGETVGGIVQGGSGTAPTFSGVSYTDTNLGTVTFDTMNDTWDTGLDGTDKWPSEYKIEDMIEKYPALKLQYLRFLEVYNLCKDDYAMEKKNDNDINF
jgi:hypothetical protein|tara:strand:- start:4242 stop:4697 length:456 start_codon:yes stop_codon:yes gene_type:complete